MAGPLILAYNLDAHAAARLKVVCAKQRVRLREVTPEECAQPIGALAGLSSPVPSETASSETFSDPMLVMCNMLSPQLDAFLQGMRDGGVPRIPLKAVLTPTNVTWNAAQLHDELAREHEAMQKQRK